VAAVSVAAVWVAAVSVAVAVDVRVSPSGMST
jgi:hypothetical protein